MQILMSTRNRNKKRVVALALLSGCLLLARATWAQTNTTTFSTSTVRIDKYNTTPQIQSAARAASSVLPQFAFGGGWYSALYFTNSTSSPASFAVNFTGNDGTPLTVPSLGASTTQVNLAANGTAIIEAPNVGSLVQGYVTFTLPAGVFGYDVFRQSVPGQLDQEAVVPLSDATATSNTLTWDETSLITAVAIVNPSAVATTVNVKLWDEDGNTVGTSSVALPAYNKTAATLRSLPGLSGMVGKRGSAQFSVSTGNVAVLGLRFDRLAFTSIPTATPASVALSRSSVLSQLAFGGGWYSALYFTNMTSSAVSFPVNFVSNAGTPLSVPSVGGSTAQVALAANGTAAIEAPNEQAVWCRDTQRSRFRQEYSGMVCSGRVSPDSSIRRRWCRCRARRVPRRRSPGTSRI